MRFVKYLAKDEIKKIAKQQGGLGLRSNLINAIQIADKVRTSGVTDLFLETVAAKATEKTGDLEKKGGI